MKALTASEAQSWCSPHNLNYGGAGTDFLHPEPSDALFDFRIPSDAGKRIYSCKALFKPLQGHTILIWYADWGVWPSGQWLPMFDRFREAFGVRNPLKDRPAYLFEPGEFDDALSFFTWAALFLWDCHVISSESGYSIFLSHDEIGFTKFDSDYIRGLKIERRS